MNAPTRTGPTVKRGKSAQDYRTPPEFLEAVEARFGPIMFDLAAKRENCVVGAGDPKGRPCYFGPDHEDPTQRDSLTQDWSRLVLAPASVSTEWFARHVERKAYVLTLRPRLTFLGQSDPYPRDLMLACYGHGLRGFDSWRWRAP